jgi:hypothetical protein
MRRLTFLLVLISACGLVPKANTEVIDPDRELTLSGSGDALDAFLRSAKNQPHRWDVTKRWSLSDGSHAVLVTWPDRPGFGDAAEIIWLAQVAQEEGLTISETNIVTVTQ